MVYSYFTFIINFIVNLMNIPHHHEIIFFFFVIGIYNSTFHMGEFYIWNSFFA